MEIFGKPLKTRVTRNRVTRIRVTRGLAVVLNFFDIDSNKNGSHKLYSPISICWLSSAVWLSDRVVAAAGKLTHNQKRFLILRGFSRASNFHQMAHWFIDQKLYCILALKYIGLHCQRQGSKKCLLFNFSLLLSSMVCVCDPFWKFTWSEDTNAIVAERKCNWRNSIPRYFLEEFISMSLA